MLRAFWVSFRFAGWVGLFGGGRRSYFVGIIHEGMFCYPFYVYLALSWVDVMT
jgi:hypothetical protein